MDNKESNNKEKILKDLELELGEIVLKLRAQIDILEQIDLEIDKAGEQLESADTEPEKIAVVEQLGESKSVTKGW